VSDSGSAYHWLVRSGDGRLRAPWRLVVGVVLVVVVATVGAAVAAGLEAVTDGSGPTVAALGGTAALVVQAGALAAGVLVAARFVDERSYTALGFERSRVWWADLGFGLALGLALPAVVFGVELAAGYVRVTGTLVSRADASVPVAPAVDPWLALALVAAYFVAVAVFEELLFRAYLLATLTEGFAWVEAIAAGAADGRRAVVAAALATSLLFGAGHAANPAATLRGVAIIACYGGLLAATVLLTGRIAVAIGFHLTWNLAISSVFGFPVSGFTAPVTVLAVEQSGPALVTGGRFGPEAGLVSLVALALGTAVVVGWVRWREGELSLRIPWSRDGSPRRAR
jgi:membrane protease YdiL (CAAX protease family)